MLSSEFDHVIRRRIGMIQAILMAKEKEYASSNDRLSNFKDGAALMDSDQVFACWAYLCKHLASVRKMVIEFTSEGIVPDALMVDEKVGDLINYLILLEGIFKEERELRK